MLNTFLLLVLSCLCGGLRSVVGGRLFRDFGFAGDIDRAKAAAVNKNVEIPVAVPEGFSDPAVAGFLIVSVNIDCPSRASLGAFKAFNPLILQTVGVNILRSGAVGFQLSVDGEASHPVGASFFRN